MEAARGLHCIDATHGGPFESIAACALETGDGIAIVDPGPATGLPGLRSGLAAIGLSTADISTVLLTHIHLDHAGATGTLVREHPRIRVFVHERGAKHVIDPSRLLSSAVRIYGDALHDLFGEVVAVPASQVVALAGGESISPGGRPLRVEYAPGHASHHVVWLDERTGTLFTGDTAGERFAPSTVVMPVTPPPDIDLEQWRETTARIRKLGPERLFVTHFGPFEDVQRHLDEHELRLEDWAARVRASLTGPGTDEERADRFVASIGQAIRAEIGHDVADRYGESSIRESWTGLARYWRKRQGE